MEITRIKKKDHKKDIIMIFIDGKFAFNIHSAVLQNTGLAVGQILKQSEVDNLAIEESYFDALDYSYLIFSYRKRTKKEVIDKLKLKDYTDEVIAKVVAALENTGYIDELEFARWWIEMRRSGRPKGIQAIEYELKIKGVENETIAKAFEIVNNNKLEDELGLARKLLDPVLGRYRKLPKNTAGRRLMSLLKRRGFSREVINDIVKEFFDEYGE